MNKTFVAVAAFVVAAFVSVPASAVTVIVDGGDYDINSDSVFGGTLLPAGGAGSWTVQFDSSFDVEATSMVTLSTPRADSFTDLAMGWYENDAGSVGALLAWASVGDGLTTLSTLFTNPNLSQFLRVSWADSTAGLGFDIDVVAVPLPASLLLIMAAFAGLAFVGRPRLKATAA